MADKKFKADMVKDGVSDYIHDLFKNIPDEWKADIAVHICFESANWGGESLIVGLGVLETAKLEYYSLAMEIMEQEMIEGQDDLSVN